MNDLDQTYKKYKDSVNMSYTELLIWSRNPKSKLASLDRRPIVRNLRLLKTKKDNWTSKDIQEAKKVISYIARARKIKRKKGIPKGVLTPNEIALRNWAFDTYK